jgi:hypothetical protein
MLIGVQLIGCAPSAQRQHGADMLLRSHCLTRFGIGLIRSRVAFHCGGHWLAGSGKPASMHNSLQL